VTQRQQIRRRMAWAIVFAVALAFALTVVKADEGDEFPVQRAECLIFEPYSWWWFFFGCNEGGTDNLLTTIEVITLEDGTQIVNVVRRERGDK
jgi:hypothetical protein